MGIRECSVWWIRFLIVFLIIGFLCNFGRRERGGGILLLIKEFGGSLIVLNHLEETNM